MGHEMRRPRREALLQSVTNPHPETTELADTDVREWVTDLPEDSDLVALSTGTAVRWVEAGWVEESH
jgi:hypothetical protein